MIQDEPWMNMFRVPSVHLLLLLLVLFLLRSFKHDGEDSPVWSRGSPAGGARVRRPDSFGQCLCREQS